MWNYDINESFGSHESVTFLSTTKESQQISSVISNIKNLVENGLMLNSSLKEDFVTEKIKYSDICIYTNNYRQSLIIEESLEKNNLPHTKTLKFSLFDEPIVFYLCSILKIIFYFDSPQKVGEKDFYVLLGAVTDLNKNQKKEVYR